MSQREITSHLPVGIAIENPLRILTNDEPGSGGANHDYVVRGKAAGQAYEDTLCRVTFQNGGIAEVGVNGVSNEALLAIVHDRLSAFQKGPYASAHNEEALQAVALAMNALHARTYERIRRGVEGRQQA